MESHRASAVAREVRAIAVVEWPNQLATAPRLDHGFVDVRDIAADELPVLLAVHFAPLIEGNEPIQETVPLFGGIVLEVDSKRVLYPQCCGDLSDAASWLAVLEPGFDAGAIAPAGHPSPEALREGPNVRILCLDCDALGPFKPKVDGDIVVPTEALASALADAMNDLVELERRLTACASIAGDAELAHALVFGAAT
ncbi:MAG: hypothetical protein KDC98_09265 [Planctomycetes bacterium]|nr:hypothetical protein [Planctomycetota bacterium]